MSLVVTRGVGTGGSWCKGTSPVRGGLSLRGVMANRVRVTYMPDTVEQVYSKSTLRVLITREKDCFLNHFSPGNDGRSLKSF